MITTQEIKSTYKRLKVAKVAYVQASTEAISLKAELEFQKLNAISNGLVVGKNATERDLDAREKLSEIHEAHTTAQDLATRKKLAFEIAQLNIDELRARLRVEEMSNNSKPHIHGKEEL